MIRVWVALAAIAAGAGLWLYRKRREMLRLRSRLESAVGALERLQLAFGRFAPPQVVEGIIAGGPAAVAQKQEVTVLFADLVDFTRLSEQLDPTVLVDVLNGYFHRMSRAIAEHRGHVAKFIGDGLLAMFGALEPNPWQCNDALHAALAMRAALAAYNDELVGRGLPALRFGVGIHRGVAVTGLVGSDQLIEFTAVGSPVNVASRVERLTRVHGVDILVTGAMQARVDPRFVLRELPVTALKGVTDAVVTFAVERFAE